ncbi:MAG: PLP-dependent transferase [Ignavibacteriales bacterium]|nr:PLP-dependent transferase [Ignavibacteriales bacterium]
MAGLALGSKELIGQVKVTRTILGANAAPDTAWLILRSLSTLQIRMVQQQENACRVVEFLHGHPKVKVVAYPGEPCMGEEQLRLHRLQCTGIGQHHLLLRRRRRGRGVRGARPRPPDEARGVAGRCREPHRAPPHHDPRRHDRGGEGARWHHAEHDPPLGGPRGPRGPHRRPQAVARRAPLKASRELRVES